jgi:hypothetical protein
MKKASFSVHHVSRVVPVDPRVVPVVPVVPVDPLVAPQDLQFRAIKTCIRDISVEPDQLHIRRVQGRLKRNQFRS